MKGKRKWAIGGMVCLLLAEALYLKLQDPAGEYIENIHQNWGVSIPSAEGKLYSVDDGESSIRAEVHYWIYSYEENEEIWEAVSWHDGRNHLVERKIDALLQDLEIAQEYTVDFEEEYWYFTLMNGGGSSELFLLYFPDQMRLSVIEDFI